MKFPWSMVLLGSWLVAAGCQPRNEYEQLQRELFQQENKIYALQRDIQQYRSVLDSCRRANLALEAELQGRADNEGLPAPRTPSGPRLTPPRVDLPGTEPPSVELPDVVLPPEIELPPGLDDPGSGAPPRFRESSHSAPVAEEAEWDAGGTVFEITLNRLLTGGYNMDGEPGDNGLLAVIEPRDRQGEIVRAGGDISLVLLDSEASGEARRFARWDFTAEEVKRHYRKSLLGHGLHFELPWPADPPVHSRMHLFARLTTADGRVLTADRPIRVEVHDHAAAAGLQRSFDQGLRRLQGTAGISPGTEPERARPDPGGLRSVLVGPELADDAETNREDEPPHVESARRPEWTPTR